MRNGFFYFSDFFLVRSLSAGKVTQVAFVPENVCWFSNAFLFSSTYTGQRDRHIDGQTDRQTDVQYV